MSNIGYASSTPDSGYGSVYAQSSPSSSGRTQSLLNASFIEPSSYPSRSPTSLASIASDKWRSSNSSVEPSSMACIWQVSEASNGIKSMDSAAAIPFGNPSLRTITQRNDEDLAFLYSEQSYGGNNSSQDNARYLDNYWTFHHPSMPIIHRATFDNLHQPPMLRAAMMAIGAQYSDSKGRRTSRILHDRCMKLLNQVGTITRTVDQG
jgi:hypothetical protein